MLFSLVFYGLFVFNGMKIDDKLASDNYLNDCKSEELIFLENI